MQSIVENEPDWTASVAGMIFFPIQECIMNTLTSVLAKMYGGLLPYSLNGPFESKALCKRHTRKQQFRMLKQAICSN